MNNFNAENLARESIRNLKPFISARVNNLGGEMIFLDANENSLGSPLTKWYNRYPDPQHTGLKKMISAIKNVDVERMLLGNGSDECIDLLVRVFCEPGIDNVIICPPAYDRFRAYAEINNVKLQKVPLTPVFQPDLEGLESAIDANTKIIFFCSPNDPTGNIMDRDSLEMVLNNFDGIVVLDEAYINFSRQRSFLAGLEDYPNLVILQTFSKAWGLAALRLGICFASKEIIGLINKIRHPYNINQSTQDLVMKALDQLESVNEMIREIVKEREELKRLLLDIPFVHFIYPSDANFLLVKMDDAGKKYDYLVSLGIVVKDMSREPHCGNCLRITIGTSHQNRKLIEALRKYNDENGRE